MEELLNMVTLFMVDDEMIEYFISTSIIKYLEKMISKESITKKSSIMNIIIIMKSLFEFKPYAFSKTLKIDLLSFLLRNYARENDSNFKNDLIGMLIQIYQNNDFRTLLSDREVKKNLLKKPPKIKKKFLILTCRQE